MLDGLDENAPSARLLGFLYQAALCERPTQSVWFLQHHLGRVLRRRVQAYFPGLVPGEWAG